MLTLSLLLFLGAALTGLTMFLYELKGKFFPMKLVYFHGVFAASALVFLILSAFRVGIGGLLGSALVLFVFAAVGGLTLYIVSSRKKSLPLPLILAHGLLAAVALVVLIIYIV